MPIQTLSHRVSVRQVSRAACSSRLPRPRPTQGGATGWLSSSAPIEPEEEFTLQLAIFDTGDGDLDSSVLLDNFRWLAGQTDTTTGRPSDVK